MTGSGKIFLLLGSNLGDRAGILKQARQMIAEKAPIVTESSIYETEPWGLTDQPAFLNQVVEVTSTDEPELLLTHLLHIEQELGRVRKVRWGARLIDIDILYYGDTILEKEILTLPHPRLKERRFTLVPLFEIAAEFVDPKLKKSVSQLLEECPDKSEVLKYS
ncbi:2-amino-4-hydroxy-6-hydroxymethyldihydropteridine diphosphokinase [Dyadobacter sp. Leaf189]|uniref:2-amino-4-hydroxy-6- hydroxymethyldihydropteridine diphosphokinase n=1 Tax=Dyadobacter sp. Leaf189 TaxID=1736295 RepID=UPI0006F6BA11|nr:2-amino-4-hydroxy-6-hydroxymethyldihydropteridine diphosphokinase [Dyadobacter sp. Leaf189]KQS25362.1 2-amino-4-hydroxy-6-hydroxymethyldihydropteridine pyrophosphokinase [Dyadobacter sp. Leaf189]